MGISSGNAMLNQYIPDMCIKNPENSQTLLYDSVTKSFKNKTITAADLGLIAPDGLLWENIYRPGDVVTISDTLLTFKSVPRSEFNNGNGADRLNDLLDVSILSPITNKEVLKYDIGEGLWVNSLLSYNDLTDLPTNFLTDITNERLGDLLDVDLTGLNIGQTIVWNGTSFVPGESGVKTFIELDDVPNGYANASGKIVAVKLDETGLEYIDIPIPTPVPSTIISMDFGSFDNANAAMDAGTF